MAKGEKIGEEKAKVTLTVRWNGPCCTDRNWEPDEQSCDFLVYNKECEAYCLRFSGPLAEHRSLSGNRSLGYERNEKCLARYG